MEGQILKGGNKKEYRLASLAETKENDEHDELSIEGQKNKRNKKTNKGSFKLVEVSIMQE